MTPLDRFLDCYRTLSRTTLSRLDDVYSADVCFSDPAHRISGLAAVKRYFASLYENATDVRFTVHHQLATDTEAYLSWSMSFRHPRLAGGRIITLEGASRLQFDKTGKVYEHCDYFDLGAMLYEHLPIVGTLVTTIKRRLGR